MRGVPFLIKALASGFYVSYLPAHLFRKRPYTGAGLVGSLWGLLALRGLPEDPLREAAVLAGVFCIAVVVSDYAEVLLGKKDDPRIVIDEFLGYWITVSFFPRTPFILALGFVLFRGLDVIKPLGVRWMGELPGGWGVVMDDVFAGLLANLALRLIEWVHHL